MYEAKPPSSSALVAFRRSLVATLTDSRLRRLSPAKRHAHTPTLTQTHLKDEKHFILMEKVECVVAAEATARGGEILAARRRPPRADAVLSDWPFRLGREIRRNQSRIGDPASAARHSGQTRVWHAGWRRGAAADVAALARCLSLAGPVCQLRGQSERRGRQREVCTAAALHTRPFRARA